MQVTPLPHLLESEGHQLHRASKSLPTKISANFPRRKDPKDSSNPPDDRNLSHRTPAEGPGADSQSSSALYQPLSQSTLPWRVLLNFKSCIPACLALGEHRSNLSAENCGQRRPAATRDIQRHQCLKRNLSCFVLNVSDPSDSWEIRAKAGGGDTVSSSRNASPNSDRKVSSKERMQTIFLFPRAVVTQPW